MNSQTFLKHTKNSAVVFIPAFIAIASIIYGLAVYSTPYEVAKASIANNPEVNEAIGSIESSWLSPFGISIKDREDRGTAKFTIYVTGELAEGKINAALKKRLGNWQVTKMALSEVKHTQ